MGDAPCTKGLKKERLKTYSKSVLYTNIDQILVNSLHELLNCEISGLIDGYVITT